VTTTLDKATAGLSPQLSALVETALAAWNDAGGMARDYSQVPLQILMTAAVRKRTVEMLYASRSSETRRRRIDPYRLDRREGRYLEMQAWCHENREVRTFALNRVLEARLTEETFPLREWNASDEGVVGGLRGGSMVAVEVCFDAVVAPFAIRALRRPLSARRPCLPSVHRPRTIPPVAATGFQAGDRWLCPCWRGTAGRPR
jgi:predicted DNA-binding transcriptional regulator YafY